MWCPTRPPTPRRTFNTTHGRRRYAPEFVTFGGVRHQIGNNTHPEGALILRGFQLHHPLLSVRSLGRVSTCSVGLFHRHSRCLIKDTCLNSRPTVVRPGQTHTRSARTTFSFEEHPRTHYASCRPRREPSKKEVHPPLIIHVLARQFAWLSKW